MTQKRLKLKKPFRIIIPVTIVVLILIAFLFIILSISTSRKYHHALDLMNQNSFTEASEIFEELGDYKDSRKLMDDCAKGIIYMQAVKDMETENYEAAKSGFQAISGFRNSMDLLEKCNAAILDRQYEELLASGNLKQALELLQNMQATGDKKKIDQKLNDLAQKFYDAGDYENALKTLDSISDSNAANNDIRTRIEENEKQAQEEREAEKKENLYQELASLEIYDDATIARAEELISELGNDYDAASYQNMIDQNRPYLGAYTDPNTGAVAYIELQGKVLYVYADGTAIELPYPQLSARNSNDEANYIEYAVHDANTIAVIVVENGEVTAYRSYVR